MEIQDETRSLWDSHTIEVGPRTTNILIRYSISTGSPDEFERFFLEALNPTHSSEVEWLPLQLLELILRDAVDGLYAVNNAH